MPNQMERFVLVVGVLLLFLMDLVQSSRASLFQSYGYVSPKYMVQAQPLYLDLEWPPAYNIGPKSSELEALQMVRCSGLEQLMRASTKDIKMGRSYRRFLVGSSLQEEQLLLLKCLPYAYDDTASEERTLNMPSTSSRMLGIQAFLISHPSFFLHLALAFLLLTFLASLLYVSMD